MPTVPPKFRRFIVVVLCLAAILLLPPLFRPLFRAVGYSIGLGSLRWAIVALVFLVLLCPLLIRSRVAKHGLRTKETFEKDDPTAGPVPSLHDLEERLRPGVLVFTASLLSFLAFCYFAYTLNDPYLLWQMDGKRFEYLVRQQSVWFPFYAGYTNDFFHSLGNIWYPLNMKLDPGFSLATDSATGALDRRLSYLIFSAEMYLSTFLLSTTLRQGVVVSSIAGWAVVLLAMPMHGLPAIYPVLAMAPNYPISQTVLVLCLFRLIGRMNHGWSGVLLVTIVFLMAHIALAHPTAMILMAPILVIFSVSILMASDNRREMTIKLLCIAVGTGTLAILGFPAYLIGMFQYSAPYFFASELFNDRAFYHFVSIAFQDEGAGVALFLLASVGAALLALYGSRLERTFAVGLITAIAVLTGAGALTVTYYDSWRGPSPIYFEFFLWPIYAVFAAATFRVLYYSGSVVFNHVAGSRLKAGVTSARAFYLVAALLLSVPWALLKHLNPHLTHAQSSFGITETPIVSLLQKEVGLLPGSLFRGRVATLTGQNIYGPVNWHDLNALDREFLSQSSNSHQSIGLWSFGIPTLFELSSLITPPFFLIAREFLERPGDLQMRNAIVLRNYNARILRALGVRYVITDAPIKGDAALRIDQEMPASARHYLYELDGVNLGGYSPTMVEVITNVPETVAALGRPAFDFTRTVVLEAPLQVDLVPATSAKVHAEPGYLRLSAASEGTSLLVLPFEFSNCLILQSTDADQGSAQIVRANLLQAGILFTRRMDATLTFFTGPLRNSGCRIQDRRDMEKLNIRLFRRDIAMPPSRFPGLQ